MFSKISKFLKDRRGNVLVTTAIAAPVMAGFAGLAVDVGHTLYSKAQLRGGTEVAALNLAETFTASNNFSVTHAAERNHSNSIASSILMAQQELPDGLAYAAISNTDIELGEWDSENEIFTPFVPNSQLILNAARVNGELSAERDNNISTYFGRMFGYEPDLRVTAHAAAPLVPSIHALNPSSDGAFTQHAGADTDSASIWVNSDSERAFVGFPSAGHGSGAIIVNGGSTHSASKIWENKFMLPDLLAEQPEPARPPVCEHTDLEIDNPGQVVLSPGSYCGGITIRDASLVSLLPGIYHFMDGPLLLEGDVRVEGRDVLLHFDGSGAVLNIQNGELAVGGREDDLYQGFVVFGSRDASSFDQHIISNARAEFSGVVYLPASPIMFRSALINGKCHSLCLVADTINVDDGAFLNWYEGFNLTGYLASTPRIAPTVLQPYLRPYLIFPEDG